MINDLTIIYLTGNEHPAHWTEFHKQKLFEAAGNYSIFTISKLPTDIGTNIIQDEPQSHRNMYRQILKACKLIETPFIAIAESDTLYSPEHFTFFRPPMNAVAYDMSRWSLYTWGTPIYSLRRRIANTTLIAAREYLIDALEERYGDNSQCIDDRVGEVGRHIHEKALGLKLRNAIEVWCHKPSVQVNHPNGIGYNQMHHPTRKRLGEIKALDIEVWGKAGKLIKNYR